LIGIIPIDPEGAHFILYGQIGTKVNVRIIVAKNMEGII
jgi:hypothetical protein